MKFKIKKKVYNFFLTGAVSSAIVIVTVLTFSMYIYLCPVIFFHFFRVHAIVAYIFASSSISSFFHFVMQTFLYMRMLYMRMHCYQMSVFSRVAGKTAQKAILAL